MFLILQNVVLVKGQQKSTHFQMHKWGTFSVVCAPFVLGCFTTQ